MKRRVLITGATSGIGEATAWAFAEAGYDLLLTGRRSERLKALKRTLEENFECSVLLLCFDVRDRVATEAALGSLPEECRRVDVLVNNAGLASGLEHIDKGDHADWNAMIDTNIKGVLNVTRIISAQMVERGSGHIVNLGSIAGTQPYENGNVYCATKHAIHGLSQAMRIDLLSHGIKVTEIRPGMVETEFSKVRFHGDEARAAAVYQGVEPLTGDDIAEAILWAVEAPDHVNIDEIVLTPKAQANSYYVNRSR
ncbi:MAG: SDR family NAD(P)-dependent oxidoreductase [Tidjanibacter sp.]|nr:SDR family NAD(P)-dependent oxidoreductase [Tidjanibacter sp.]